MADGPINSVMAPHCNHSKHEVTYTIFLALLVNCLPSPKQWLCDVTFDIPITLFC